VFVPLFLIALYAMYKERQEEQKEKTLQHS
jgi:hypothetical protein